MKSTKFAFVALAMLVAVSAAFAGKQSVNLQKYRVVSFDGTFASPTKYIVQATPITGQTNPSNYICDQVEEYCTIVVDLDQQTPVSEGAGLVSFVPQAGALTHEAGEYIAQ